MTHPSLIQWEITVDMYCRCKARINQDIQVDQEKRCVISRVLEEICFWEPHQGYTVW